MARNGFFLNQYLVFGIDYDNGSATVYNSWYTLYIEFILVISMLYYDTYY